MHMRAKKPRQRNVVNEVPVEKIIKGFANKRRLEIITLLETRSNLDVEGISEALGIEFKNASAHISKLAIAGIVHKKYQGHRVLHSLTGRGKNILKFVRIIE